MHNLNRTCCENLFLCCGRSDLAPRALASLFRSTPYPSYDGEDKRSDLLSPDGIVAIKTALPDVITIFDEAHNIESAAAFTFIHDAHRIYYKQGA